MTFEDQDIRQISLKDALEFIVDNRGKTAPTAENGIALIATNCVNNRDLYPKKENLRYVSQETFETWFRAHPKPGDILLTNKGSQNGAVCLVPNPVDFCIAQDMVALRANSEQIEPLYLLAALRSELVQNRIKALNVDAVIPHFKKTDFDKLYLPFPRRSIQKFIGDLYFELSQRIEFLRETNATLEAIAQALFKSWFVDFDPVRAKQQGLAPEGMEEATAALYPDGFEESELGMVPKGWKTTTVQGLTATIFSGGTPDTRNPAYWNGHIPWFSSGETRNRIVTDTEKQITESAVQNSSTKLALPGDILIASAGQGYTRGQTSYCTLQTYINQSVVSVRAVSAICHPVWLFYNLSRRYDEMRSISDSHSSRGSLTTKLLAGMKVLAPSIEIVRTFADVVEPLVSAQASNARRAAALAQVRDMLLPRLISGQLRLPDIEQPDPEALLEAALA